MRYILFVHIILISMIGCHPRETSNLPADIVRNPNTALEQGSPAAMPELSFDRTEHDFGRIIQGEVVTYTFKFTNTGQADLIISSVSTSCGCTISKYTDQPVKPGLQGTVQVTFDSKGRKGFQNKTVTVLSNTQPNRHTLQIKARVIIPEE